MIKSHIKSKIYRVRECDLKDIEGVVVQVEHIPQPINNNYHCLVEVVTKEDFKFDTDYDNMESELHALKVKHETLCRNILPAFGEYETAETAEVKSRGHLSDALDLANDWFC